MPTLVSSQLSRLTKAVKSAASGPPLPELDDLQPLTQQVTELIQDRLDAGWREGLLAGITAEQFEAVQCAILGDDQIPRKPSTDAVGTSGRLAVYADRATARKSIFSPSDANPAANDRRPGVRIRSRGNGGHGRPTAKRKGNGEAQPTIKAMGWASEAPKPLPAGIYRTDDGAYFEICDEGEDDE